MSETQKFTGRVKWEAALTTESFEAAQTALTQVQELRGWRSEAERSVFKPFFKLVEGATAGAGADQLTMAAVGLTPRVADLYLGLVAELEGSKYEPQFDMTQKQLDDLMGSGDWQALTHPNVPWSVKQNRMQTRVISELKGRLALDRRDRQEREQNQPPTEPQTTPPPASDESKPSMDEMARLKEGEEVGAIWTIEPGYGGYFRQQSFNGWDGQQNKWVSRYKFETVPVQRRLKNEGDLTLSARLPAGQWTRVPIPYTYVFCGTGGTETILEAQWDQNGDYVVRAKKPVQVKLVLAPYTGILPYHQGEPNEDLNFEAQWSEETGTKLEEVGQMAGGNVDKARKLLAYTIRRLKYSNDGSFNQIYATHPRGYIGGIDELKQADCDVANTYSAALCAELKIPVRLVTGQMVKGKDKDGNSRITSGTGHAWLEVWDEASRDWVRLDATPPGDPQLEQEQFGEGVPGDYGEQEAIGPTDEELAELEQKLTELTEKLSYTRQERELAEAAGIELNQARQVVKEIQMAENTRLPNGERVVDVLAQLFSLIIESRRTTKIGYTGPVRKREGGEEISDIVAHVIGIRSGQVDPLSRSKPAEEEREELIFGGFDVRIIGDKSVSMGETVDGEAKWKAQRQGLYLILSSLYRFGQNLQRARIPQNQALGVRTQVVSFRGSGEGELDEDKPLSGEFSAKDKVGLWQSLGKRGHGNGDVEAMAVIKTQVEADTAENRLRIILVCSDGEPDDKARVRQLAQELGQMNTVTIGVGITATAGNVPVIFDTPYSRGVVVGEMNDLPVVLAAEVIKEAVKLFPEKGRKNLGRFIQAIMDKF